MSLVESAAYALFFVALCNLASTIHSLGLLPTLSGVPKYNYVGYNFPAKMPLARQADEVQVIFEDSVHFPLQGPAALPEWSTVYPEGFGFVRMGPENRVLCVSMFHQLHCLDKLLHNLLNPDDHIATIPHLHHCLNYLRQMVLCAADITLEPAVYDPVQNKTFATSSGVTHTCRDWTAVYETVNENYAQWVEFAAGKETDG